MPDRIELRGLRALGLCGILPEEGSRAQPLEVDLDIEADLYVPGSSDELGDTIDYSAVCAMVERIITAERFHLLEALATRLAEAALVDERVAGGDGRRAQAAPARAPPPRHLRRAHHPHPRPAGVTRAFLGLGSNLGDRRALLRSAVDALPDVVAVSPLYETDPVGGPDQGAFLNLVVELSTERSARELLAVCAEREAAAERVRVERWGPRTLDVDVLWVDGETVDEPDLVVPHPRMWERRFVLAPLRDLAPDLVSADEIEAAEGDVRLVGPL